MFVSSESMLSLEKQKCSDGKEYERALQVESAWPAFLTSLSFWWDVIADWQGRLRVRSLTSDFCLPRMNLFSRENAEWIRFPVHAAVLRSAL